MSHLPSTEHSAVTAARPLSPIPSIDPLDVDLGLDLDLDLGLGMHPDTPIAPAHDAHHGRDHDRYHDHEDNGEHVDRLEQEWPSTPSPPPPMPSSLLVVKRPLAFPTLTSGTGGETSSVIPGESSLSMSLSSIRSHDQPVSVVVSPPLHPVHVIPVSASIHSRSAKSVDNVPTTPTSRAPAAPSSTTSSPSPNRTSTLTASKKPPLSSRTSRPRPRATSIPATPTPLSPTLSAATSTTTSRKPKPAAAATLLHQRQRRGSTSTLASGTTSVYSTSTANVPQYAGAPTRPGGVVHHSIKRVSAAYEPDGMGPVPRFPDQDMARLVVRHAHAPSASASAAASDVGDSVSMIHTPPTRHAGGGTGSASISILTHASDSQSTPMFPMSQAPATTGGHGHVCMWELGVCCHEWTDPNPSVRRAPRVCGMRFNSGDALYKHLTEHHVETGADAARCGHCHWRGCVKVFRNTSKYLRRDHFKKHITELVEYVCLDCGRVCDKEYGSGRHICREGAPPPKAAAAAAAANKAEASTSVAASEVRRVGSEDSLPRGMTGALIKPTPAAAPVAVHVSNTTEHHHHHAHRHEHEGDLHVHFDSPTPTAVAVNDTADDADSATKASSSVEEWVRNDALAAIRHHQLKQQQQQTRSPLGVSDTEDEPSSAATAAAAAAAGPAKLTLATLPQGISPAEFLAHHVDPALVSELERMVTSSAPAAPTRDTSEWGIQTSPLPPPTPTSPSAPTPVDPLAHYAELATVILSQLTTLHAQADAQAEAIQHLIDAQVPLRAVPATLVDVVQALSAVAGAHQGVATRLAKVEEGVSAAGSVVGDTSRRPSEDHEVGQVAAAAAAESFRFAPTPTNETDDDESVADEAVDEEDKDDSAYASAVAAAAPVVPTVEDIAQETAAVLEPKLESLLDSHAQAVEASHAELAARLEMLESAASRREQETAALVEQVPATIMAAVARQLAAMEARLASVFTGARAAVVEKRDMATSMTPPASPKMRGLDQVEKSPPVSLLSDLIHQASASSLVGPTAVGHASSTSSQPPVSPTTRTEVSASAASDILSFFTTTRSRTLERYEPKKVVVPITLATPGSPTFSTAFSLSSSTNVAGAGAGSSTSNVSMPVVPEVTMPTSPTRAVPADTVSAPVRHRHPAWNAQPLDSGVGSSPKPSPVSSVVALATEPASTSSSPRSKSLKRLSIIPTPPPLSPPALTRSLPAATEASAAAQFPTPQSSNSVASTTSPTFNPTTSFSTTSVQSAPPAPLRRPLTLGYSPLIQVDIPKSTPAAAAATISPPSPSVSPTRSMIAIPTHHSDDAYATLRSVHSVTVGTMTKAKKKRGVGRMWQAVAKVLGGSKKREADRASVSSVGAGTASGRYVGTSTSARRV